MYRVMMHPGRTLWEELAEQNIVIDRPCGGKGTCGRCEVTLRGGKRVRACQYRTVGQVEVQDISERSFEAVGSLVKQEEIYTDTPVAAVDIGTTTVVLTLFYRGRSVTRSFVNPQRRFGADVMSRIQAANEGHAEDMQTLIMERLLEEYHRGVEILMEEADMQFSMKPGELVISANTTMQHLLEGLSCRGLGEAPFMPKRLDLRHLERSFSLEKGVKEALKITQLPGISAFVGADIVSGLASIHILDQDKPVLFVDLGTNGEMALGCRERLLVTSTAAGPAFEGSELAVQIHGAGILKLLHELLQQNVIDEYGTLCEDYFESGYPVEVERYRSGTVAQQPPHTCMLTQEMIREIQMAKAAVCAGIEMLLETYGISPEQVAKVYLAGGFGYYLDPEDAWAVGVLPNKLGGTVLAVGNTSLQGAVAYVADPKRVAVEMEQICSRAEVISLPDCKKFQERYIENMNF